MRFLDSDFNLRILSVLDIEWQETDTFVSPRPYNAISIRLCGDSSITDQCHTDTLKTGTLLFMPENVGYYLKSNYEHILVVHFELNGVKQNSFEIFSIPTQVNTFTNIFTSLYDSWRNKETGYYFHCVSLLYRLFELIVQRNTSQHAPSYQLIKPAIDYMHTHFTDNSLTIEFLYNLCNLSDTYFRRLFFKEFHTTPLKYINTMRIDYAEELLQTGFYTISYVSQKVGFADPKYFSTAFKKIKGYPPSCCK